MNKSKIGTQKLEQQPNDAVKADGLPSAQVEQNPMLSAALSTIEGNKLIAEFMGHTWRDRNYYYNEEGYLRKAPAFGYNISWDLLMPVVEKIDFLGYPSRIDYRTTFKFHHLFIWDDEEDNPVSNGWSESKITAVWLGVVMFIQWHNVIKAAPKR